MADPSLLVTAKRETSRRELLSSGSRTKTTGPLEQGVPAATQALCSMESL